MTLFCLALALLHKLMSFYFVAQFCITHFGVAVRGKSHFKLLALVIPYLRNHESMHD